MKYFSNITAISELSESEGVFTTAQAARMDISRDALAHSCRVGRLERICHGAYRMSGAQRRDTDELNALWKLTNPSLCAWERKRQWDGIAVSGTTAANLQQMGDFHLSPLQDDRAHAHQYEKRFPFFCKARDCRAGYRLARRPAGNQARAHACRSLPRLRGPLINYRCL